MKSFMKNKALVAEIALFLAAFIWGLSFIYQRDAMSHMTPFAYLGLRFFFGALPLLPFAVKRLRQTIALSPDPKKTLRNNLLGGLLAGTLVFLGSAFQQYGIVWTTVAKTGFITSLYVVIVPLILFLFGRRVLPGESIGAFLALVGLFLLSVTDTFTLALGDALVLGGALVWALHVICLGWISPKMNSFVLGTGQSLVCGALGLGIMLWRKETPSLAAIQEALPTLLGGSLLAVTVGFTLQIFGQKDASPAAAAIILQMEAVFAAIFGYLLLGESMTTKMLAGAVVMLAGALITQLWPGSSQTSSNVQEPG